MVHSFVLQLDERFLYAWKTILCEIPLFDFHNNEIMVRSESLEAFYKRNAAQNGIKPPSLEGLKKGTGHLNVYRREDFCKGRVTPYNRRDFYKVSLVIGRGTLYYADKGISVDQDALLFSNPTIPYSWEPAGPQAGYFTLFTENFITLESRSLNEANLFRAGGTPVFFPTPDQVARISDIFEKMLVELDSDYIHKYDVLRNYLSLVLHEALKLRPADSYFQHTNASARIASLFIELLERQFPIDTPDHVLRFKRATDYASRLSVHVNHLNRAVKEVTGKTTTEHIADRITNEAKALLRHTDWNVSEIAYSLGFEYPAYFNNFFKKQTDQTPRSFRQ